MSVIDTVRCLEELDGKEGSKLSHLNGLPVACWGRWKEASAGLPSWGLTGGPALWSLRCRNSRSAEYCHFTDLSSLFMSFVVGGPEGLMPGLEGLLSVTI